MRTNHDSYNAWAQTNPTESQRIEKDEEIARHAERMRAIREASPAPLPEYTHTPPAPVIHMGARRQARARKPAAPPPETAPPATQSQPAESPLRAAIRRLLAEYSSGDIIDAAWEISAQLFRESLKASQEASR